MLTNKHRKVKTKAVGICLGASTISLVEISKNGQGVEIENITMRPHEGDPKGVLTTTLDQLQLDGKYLGLTGRKFRQRTNIASITEPEATEWAFLHINKKKIDYDAIVSAGGETFMVYEMDKKRKISRVSTGNKCASGTGEFFMQQIHRMDVNVKEAVQLSSQAENPYELSGRCSVFCKSDCTHALNKGKSVADVAAGLAKMIAKKIEELLVRINAKKVLVVGGTARNGAVVGFLKKEFEQVDVPEEAPYFEALGAALWALDKKQSVKPEKGKYYRDANTSFDFLKPLADFQDLVDFKTMEHGLLKEGDRCIIGLDVGSTTTKAVLLRVSDNKILSSEYLRTNGQPVKAAQACYRSLWEQLKSVKPQIIGLGVTGSGRYITGLHAQTESVINEIIAHAKAASHFDPEVDTIFEIGGQDAKYTFLTNSVASDYAMNEACSAGTGSFLEESAQESLGVKMEDIADIALGTIKPPNFSDQCAAFISSDIKTALQEGIEKRDIIAGLVYSICINYLNRVKGSRQVGKKIFMQGGVCYNRAVPVAMAALSGKKIIVPPEPGLMGAYGVALEVENLMELGLLEEKTFDLATLASREVEYGKSFICHGSLENCDRRCEINMVTVEGEKIPFGGACNKYYNLSHHLKYNVDKLNHIPLRRELVFKRFVEPDPNIEADAPVVGINKSFQTHTLYPFYFNFFNALGCRVVLPEKVHESGIKKGMTSFCLSGQIALGMFEDLLTKNPDYIFMPQIMEMNVTEQKEYRKEYQTVCMFVQGEPFYQKATFLRNGEKHPVMITPALNFMRGFDSEEKTFLGIARQLGFSDAEGVRAHRIAFEKQQEFFRAMKAEGRRILAELESDPNRRAVVLFGRPYNAFSLEANKGIPNKFVSRGVEIIPYDFLAYEEEPNFRDTYWEMGQRIIRAARIVKRHPQLFGCYLTNFLCALDSMMVPHFRDLMMTKPSLTLEVDEHTADAGVNTRIEAFLDVIKNYLKIKDRIHDPVLDFNQAKVSINARGELEYVDSSGKPYSIKDKQVKVVIPSMGDLFAQCSAAVFRGMGWDAQALPVCDREALDLGRSVTTGKECLPIINIVGELLKYLKYRKNSEEKLAIFLVAAGGCCRVGQYEILMKTTIDKLKLKDVAVITLENDSGYAGLGLAFRLGMVKGLYAADVMDDIRSAIKAMAVNKEEGINLFWQEWNKLMGSIDKSSRVPFFKQLKSSARNLSKIKLEKPIAEAKYIGIVGEIFVRRDHFSLLGLPEILANHGFVMLDAHVMEWIRYTDFLREINMFEAKTSMLGKLESFISDLVQVRTEKKVKKLLAGTGLYEYELLEIKKYMRHSEHLFPWTLTGEPGLSTGSALYHLGEKYCGIVNIGPFGCMNSRITESVTTFEMNMEGKERAAIQAGEPVDLTHLQDKMDVLPFLSIESDGNPFSQVVQARIETFLLQADRLHGLMMEKKANLKASKN